MKAKKPKANSLSFLLLKTEFKTIQEALKSDIKADILQEEINGVRYYLVVKKTTPGKPKWLSVFSNSFAESLASLYTASSSALLAYETESRWFVIPFGYGRSMLKAGSYEENFGLKIVLNVVDPLKLRSVDAQNLETISIYQRSQASKATNIGDFGINVERDILFAATGETTSEKFGKTITGKDAIKLVLPATIENLPDLSRELLQKYLSVTYKESFPWIDNLLEIRDQKVIDFLNEKLIQSFRADAQIYTWLTVPEIIEWEFVEGFKYNSRVRGKLFPDISWDTLFQSLCKKEDLHLALLKERDILCIGRENDEIIHQWPIYRCIYAEIDSDGKFVLNNGKWYKVDSDFVKSVDDYFASIEYSNISLPEYSHKSEGEYNSSVVELDPTRYALCDKKNIPHGGGYSRIEFCDIFSTSGEIIHVKRYGGSSVLSHLFAQGVVSARLFLMDSSFRKKVEAILPETHKPSLTSQKPDSLKFQIIFGIITNSTEAIIKLPLFSKITLKNAATTLAAMGFSTKLKFIPTNKEYLSKEELVEDAA